MCEEDVIGRKGLDALAASATLRHNMIFAALGSRVSYILVLLCVKLSIAVLLQRLLSVTSRRMNIACWAAIVLSLAWAIYALVVFLAICSPANGSDKSGAGCSDSQKNLTIVYAIDVFTDLVLLALPLKPISTLHMAKAHKVALLLMFSGGIV